jgi:hypothetical protein
MGERKLRSGVNLRESLKQKGVKQTGVKQGMGIVCVCVSLLYFFLLLQKFLKYRNDLLLYSSDERE